MLHSFYYKTFYINDIFSFYKMFDEMYSLEKHMSFTKTTGMAEFSFLNENEKCSNIQYFVSIF